MKRVSIVFSLVAAAFVISNGATVLGWLGRSTAPPVLGEVPAFHLVSDAGTPFDLSLLDGRAWIASFLYSSCPGPCPRLVERLKTVRQRIPASRLAIVSFSVDPATDTPDVLTTYKGSKGIAGTDDWVFVTGPPDDVLAVVQRGFLTGVERSGGKAEEGAVTHGVKVVLVDGAHQIRGFYSTDSDEELDRLERDVAGLE